MDTFTLGSLSDKEESDKEEEIEVKIENESLPKEKLSNQDENGDTEEEASDYSSEEEENEPIPLQPPPKQSSKTQNIAKVHPTSRRVDENDNFPKHQAPYRRDLPMRQAKAQEAKVIEQQKKAPQTTPVIPQQKETVPNVNNVRPKLPTTQVMVDTAIMELNERSGSSIYAIKKFIMGRHDIVDGRRLMLNISRYVKKSVSEGKFEQIRMKFKISSEEKKKIRKAGSKTEKKQKALPKKKKTAATSTEALDMVPGTSKSTATLRNKAAGKKVMSPKISAKLPKRQLAEPPKKVTKTTAKPAKENQQKVPQPAEKPAKATVTKSKSVEPTKKDASKDSALKSVPRPRLLIRSRKTLSLSPEILSKKTRGVNKAAKNTDSKLASNKKTNDRAEKATKSQEVVKRGKKK